MAKDVQRVVGVEMVASAVEDAKHNAKLNHIENIEFICGKAEDVCSGLMKSIGKTIAIVYV